MPLIELSTFISAPAERCFDLARSIDLHRQSTEGTREQAIAGVTSGLIGMGEHVTWRARHFGITQTLTSVITAFDQPRHFRDEMVDGAFRMIRHDHCFAESGGGTLMTDRFYFESPGGIAGSLFNRLLLARYLRKLLERRNAVIKNVAESDEWEMFLKQQS